MSYISGKERTFLGLDRGEGFGGFGGFGGVEDLLPPSCTAKELYLSPEGCAEIENTRKTVLAAYQKSQSEIAGLSGSFGPVLAEALDGASNPTQIAAKAKALADGFAGQDWQKNAYQFFYSQTRAGMQVVDGYLSAYPPALAAKLAAETGMTLYEEGKSIYQKFETSGLDACGVADCANLIKRGVAGVRAVARLVGVQPGSATEQVMEWGSVAAGCGASIATGVATGTVIGAAAGALTCAVSVLGQLFNLLKKPDPPPSPAKDMLFAVFKPKDKQRGLVAADAVRLASLLKYRYGMASYDALMANWWAARRHYPMTGFRLLPENAPGSTEPSAAFTTGDVIDVVSSWAGGKVYPLSLLPGSLFDHWGDACSVSDLVTALNQSWTKMPYADMASCRRYVELINFFAAVTLRELDTDPAGYLAPWRDCLPVTSWAVGEGGEGPDSRIRTSRYSAMKWTRMGSWGGRHLTADLIPAVASRNPSAILELAGLRLQAALSYMQMLRVWGEPAAGGLAALRGGKDIIADLPSYSSLGPAAALRLPLDPRSPTGGSPVAVQALYTQAVNLQKSYDAIAGVAWQQAVKDHGLQVQAAGALQKAYFMQKVGAGGGIESPGALKAKIQALEKAGTVFTHTPTTTPTDWMEPAGESGGGGVILAAAAGLAALLLLRK
ncbi:hypothetical protein KJ966_31720 [bacterium]|nr:hypothetical protein [bacterium]